MKIIIIIIMKDFFKNKIYFGLFKEFFLLNETRLLYPYKSNQ
jgi:hypothetical protein